jgi:uroporphyrin-III C-methyltransferase
MTGLVSLVGAGPGDPELLTRRAVRRLRAADVVFYDDLVAAAALRLASRAQRVAVGKRAGRPSMSQDHIHDLMVAAARKGHRVVRLKGGDPFVLGRGGEEAVALRRASVPCEIVPGISAAFAAPACAGIPVTQRGVSSAVVVVSGHAAPAYEPVLSSVAPGAATIVVLMGIRNHAPIALLLLARGWDAATPVAVVFDAASRRQRVWAGTLTALSSENALAARHDARGRQTTGTIVIGGVVPIREEIAAAVADPVLAGTSRCL